MSKMAEYEDMAPMPEIQNMNDEAEEALLDCILINPYSIREALFLRPEWMGYLRYRYAFQALITVYERGETPDEPALIAELKLTGLWDEFGGYDTLMLISGRAKSSLNTYTYATIVARNAFKRGIAEAGEKIIRLSNSDESNTMKLLQEAHELLDAIPGVNLGQSLIRLSETHDSEFSRLEAIQNGEMLPAVGLSSGYIDMDELLGGGFQPGELIVIAGRPGWGKTSLMLNLATNMTLSDNRVIFFSLEMNEASLTRRITSMITGIASQKLRDGRLDEAQWNEYVKHSATIGQITHNIIVNKMSEINMLTLPFVRIESRMKVRSEGAKAIFFDYLGLMQSGDDPENRRAELETICRNLKVLAEELEVPIILATQMNRAVEMRSTHEPMLSDLRETGATEQDADIVMFIYPLNEETSETRRKVKFEKHRNGSPGSFFLAWEPKRTLLRNFANDYGYSSRALWERKDD